MEDRQGASGVALAIALLAMSSFPSLVSIPFFFVDFYLGPDPSSDCSTPLHAGPGAPRRGIAEGSSLVHRASRSPKATESARDIQEASPRGYSRGTQKCSTVVTNDVRVLT